MPLKKLLLTAVTAITLTAGSFTAQAACVGCNTGVAIGDIDLDYLYHWEGTYKFQNWTPYGSGQTMTWVYVTVSGTTQQYCQNQLYFSGSNVVRHCYKVRN